MTALLQDRCIRVTSGGTPYDITYIPHDGNGLYLFDSVLNDWDLYPIPYLTLQNNNCTVEGVPNSTLPFGVVRYIYAYLDANGSVDLDFCAAQEAIDLPTGFLVKSGDKTRRLVGMCYALPSGKFGDGAGDNLISTYFHRLQINLVSFIGGTVSGSTWTAVGAPIRGAFWGDGSEPHLIATGTLTNNTAGASTYVGISIDGNPPADMAQFTAANANQCSPFAVTARLGGISEGFHSFQLMLMTSSGSGSLPNGASMTCCYNG